MQTLFKGDGILILFCLFLVWFFFIIFAKAMSSKDFHQSTRKCIPRVPLPGEVPTEDETQEEKDPDYSPDPNDSEDTSTDVEEDGNASGDEQVIVEGLQRQVKEIKI